MKLIPQPSGFVQEALQRLARAAQSSFVRDAVRHLHREPEARRGFGHLFAGREMMGAVDPERLGAEMLTLQRRMRHEGEPREVVAVQMDEAAKL